MADGTVTLNAPGSRAAALVAMGAIIALSIGPLPVPDLPGWWGSVPHTVAYAVLTWFLLAARPRSARSRSGVSADRGRELWWAVGVAISVITLGVVMEIGQAIIGRDSELRDVVADVVGVAIASVAWFAVRRRSRSSERSVSRS